MEMQTWLIIYILLLVTTIILVVMKKTHWGSIIGVALIPIYFIWVLFDASRSSDTKKSDQDPKEEIS